ncbi:hypothetical protein NL108_010955 [Boleophthalmus pectinirostris]|uniref:uncharacterized protein C7orf57 homolog isoform X1 n=1 Tax=Boleophthalmus pectinirostris TaxID=150288 RepID=UPI00242A8AD2|nr:uncharacterized protein C7orf57 homolog isoform X1 [Boleophthalmus pectinirostris]KAJ0062357.1 hypothetical protein NL108_010955 [Boleophthalmus pectinirostris]
MSTAVPNHRRVKPGAIKPGAGSIGVTGPSSQIPGLSQISSNTSPTERISCRRVGIFESDSDYVKLAKQGGHKGLLSHDIVEDAPRKAYSPPNFFGNDESKSGSNGSSPDGQPKGRQPLTAPFGTDSEVHWEKESDRFSGTKKASPDGAVQQMEALSITHKYKRTSYEKKAPPVSMSKLLSHGYVEEKKSADDDTSSVTSEMTSTLATDDVGVDDLE